MLVAAVPTLGFASRPATLGGSGGCELKRGGRLVECNSKLWEQSSGLFDPPVVVVGRDVDKDERRVGRPLVVATHYQVDQQVSTSAVMEDLRSLYKVRLWWL